MDANSNQTTNGTINNAPTTNASSRPPAWVWVLVALAAALTVGVIAFGLYQFVVRRRVRKQQQRDAEGGGGSDAVPRGRGGSRLLWGRRRRSSRRRSRSQHGNPSASSRWGWVYPHHHGANRASGTQSSEGLNELGEAPPPYNEDDLEPCLLGVDMAEVHALGLGEGPGGSGGGSSNMSRAASRQDRGPLSLAGEARGGFGPVQQPHTGAHPEPPAYDFAVNLGGASTTTMTTTPSIQQPAPVAVLESRGA